MPDNSGTQEWRQLFAGYQDNDFQNVVNIGSSTEMVLLAALLVQIVTVEDFLW